MLQMIPQQGSAVCSCPHTVATGQRRRLRHSTSSCSRTRPSIDICLCGQPPLLLQLLHMGRRQSCQPSLALLQLPTHCSQVCNVCGQLETHSRRLPGCSCSAATDVMVCPRAGMP